MTTTRPTVSTPLPTPAFGRRRRACLLALALSAANGADAQPVAAQAGAGGGVRPGERVRVRAPAWDGAVVATVAGTERDTLRLVPVEQGRFPFSVPLASVTRLERSHGRASPSRHMMLGAAAGFVGGGLTGLALGASLDKKPGEGCLNVTCDEANRDRNADRRQSAATLGAGVGFVIGTFVGARNPGERWERVPLPLGGARVGVGPRGEARLALTLVGVGRLAEAVVRRPGAHAAAAVAP
jgi:hypothetical protein